MKAALSVELELLEPALVDSAASLRDLHPKQIRWISVRLTTDGEAESPDSVTFAAQSDDARTSIQNLVAFAQKSQPEGTPVRVWYQGRSEDFVI